MLLCFLIMGGAAEATVFLSNVCFRPLLSAHRPTACPAWNLDFRTNNGALESFTVDTKNQLTSALGAGCAYDANGNLMSNGHFSYVYDDENQLIQWFYFQYGSSADTNGDLRTDFYYDGLGRQAFGMTRLKRKGGKGHISTFDISELTCSPASA